MTDDLPQTAELRTQCVERKNCVLGLGQSCPEWLEHLVDVTQERVALPSNADLVPSLSERLRAHLIDAHGYTADYFDEDYVNGGPIDDLGTLRWLHACWVKTLQYPQGCERI